MTRRTDTLRRSIRDLKHDTILGTVLSTIARPQADLEIGEVDLNTETFASVMLYHTPPQHWLGMSLSGI